MKKNLIGVQKKVKLHILRKMSNCPRGFTLIETLIAVLLVVVLGIVSAGMVSFFARYTRQDTISTCLLQAASSGIEAKRAKLDTTSIEVPCGGYTAAVNVTTVGTLPDPAPAMGTNQSACVEIESTSTIGDKSMSIKDLICNFPEGG